METNALEESLVLILRTPPDMENSVVLKVDVASDSTNLKSGSEELIIRSPVIVPPDRPSLRLSWF